MKNESQVFFENILNQLKDIQIKHTAILNEINAVPGSMAYYLFCDKFSQFKELLTSLIEEGVERKRKEDKYVTFYKSEILYGDYKGVKK